MSGSRISIRSRHPTDTEEPPDLLSEPPQPRPHDSISFTRPLHDGSSTSPGAASSRRRCRSRRGSPRGAMASTSMEVELAPVAPRISFTRFCTAEYLDPRRRLRSSPFPNSPAMTRRASASTSQEPPEVPPERIRAVGGAIGSLICWESYMPARSRGSVPKEHHDLHLTQHQRQPGVAGHHSTHRDRGQVLLRQRGHGHQTRLVSLRPA